MHEQTRQFEAFSGAEIAVGAIAVPATLITGSEIYKDLTHFPANIEVPPGQHNPYWRPTGLEKAGVGVALPLLASAGLVALTSLTRRFIHNHRQQPPRTEAPVPAGE
jgi:hypothetical protein